ncbi:MAG: tRNA (adenosine(37)-N6)-threonylcarbamoyltransferase complex ATPase subunit type 1 TsaE, partial [Stellaceae bacterium]
MATIDLPDENATAALAARLAAVARPGDVIALKGELGAGKTS